MKCPHCKQDELKPYKDFYCCYGCGEIVKDMKTPKAPNVSLKLKDDLKSWLKVHCAKNELSMTEVITELLERYKSKHDGR